MLSRCLYRILLWVLFPAVTVYTAFIATRQGGSRYFKQRFGIGLPKSSRNPLWMHCASIGELNTALPLIKHQLETDSSDIVVTTATATSARVLESYALERVRHCYLPLDYPSLCRRFLTSFRPRCALIMETEIWLHLFRECHRQNIPLYLLNARLSKRTLSYSKLLSGYYRHSLAAVNHIYARSQKDRECYAVLSAGQTRISVAGNLKYAAAANRPVTQKSPCHRRYFLAASTHEGEEVMIASALRAVDNEQLLVIVPRHPERGKSIRGQLEKQGFGNILLRSEAEDIGGDTSIYIADTVGELMLWIAHAQLVFTGGSLVNKGGHNLLEPAMLGTPQITGRHTENFAEEAENLLRVNGLLQVENETELADAFRNFIASREVYQEMARNARRYAADECGSQTLSNYTDILKRVT